MNIHYKWNYIAALFSALACLICAITHDLTFLLINFFFVTWNWFIAEYKRGKENEKDNNRDSNDSDSASQDTEDEDQE